MQELSELPALKRLEATPSQAGYLGPALVRELDEREGLALIEWTRSGESCLSWARPAMAGSSPQCGDQVLLLSHNLEEFYIIGVLARIPATCQSAPASLQTSSGARALAGQFGGEEIIQVHSPKGALVLQYHPQTGKTMVNVETGDLEFVARNGGITFRSARKIAFVTRRLETLAETVVSKAKNVYRTVEELTQLQTGRWRTLIKGSCHLKAREAFLKTEEDFKVDAKQIHLG